MKPIINLIATLLFVLYLSLNATGQIINTYAGTGIAGYSGDGGIATNAQLNGLFGLAIDDSGNLYIAEKVNNVIRKVAADGIISTFAGTGVAGYTGDGGPATNAQINTPYDIAADHSGNVYFTDNGNNKIRKIDRYGTITTSHITVLAYCPGICGIPGVETNINDPTGIAISDSGIIYISSGDNIVLKVNHGNMASLFAGNCCYLYGGDGGPATIAGLNHPIGLAVDHAGNVYIGDQGNNVVRKVNTAGIITTYAGNGAAPGFYGDGGPATDAGFWGPFGVTTDNYDNVYVQDIFNHRIRKINSSGIVTTVAGDGTAGYSGDGGPAADAEFYDCTGFAVDSYNNLYIADIYYSVVRKVTMPPTLGIVENNSNNDNLMLYPNPNRGIFNIEGTLSAVNDKTASLEVINIVGQSVYKNNVAVQNGKIDARIALENDLPSGTYLLHITSGGEHAVLRFVLEK